MGFSRHEYWRGWPFPSPEDLSNPWMEPGCPAWQVDSLPSEPAGKPNLLTLTSFYSCDLTVGSKIVGQDPRAIFLELCTWGAHLFHMCLDPLSYPMCSHLSKNLRQKEPHSTYHLLVLLDLKEAKPFFLAINTWVHIYTWTFKYIRFISYLWL